MPKKAVARNPQKRPPKNPVQAKKPKPKPAGTGTWTQDILFFGLFFLFLWLRVDPRLIFHGGWNIPDFPVFYKGWFFFREYLGRPGGAVEYASSYLAQFLVYPVTGAAVITAQAWLVSACAGGWLGALVSPRLKALRFIPALMLLALYSAYTFHFTVFNSLAAALLFVVLCRRIPRAGGRLDFAAPMILSAALYVLSGGAVLVFAVLCAADTMLLKRRWKTGLAVLAMGVLIPYAVGVHVYGTSVREAFTALTPWSWKILQFHPRGMAAVYALILVFPLTALALTLLRPAGLSSRGPGPYPGSEPRGGKKRWAVETAVLLAILALTAFLSLDRKLKTLLEVDYCAYHRMWSGVLEKAGDNPQDDLVMAAVDRALAHTGRLGDSESALRQQPGTLLLNDAKYRFSFWFQFDIFLDLGYVNKADHQLTEALDYYGERPQILRRLALVNLVKGNTGTARIYLGALGRMPFHSKEAEARLVELDSDPSLAGDPEVQHLRASMLKTDRIREQSFDGLFLELLEINPKNRMAFEYLMTFYLLTLDIENFTLNAGRFRNFDYPQIPRLYEQAILLAGSMPSLRDKVRAADLNVSAESRRLFFEFVRTLRTARAGGNAAALTEFPESLRNSYLFYYRYSAVPAGRKAR